MKITINREKLLIPLQQIIGAVERRQTLPILGNVLFKSSTDSLTLTATDLEIEMVSRIANGNSENFETTLPARKLLDICKALAENSEIEFTIEENKVTLTSGRSRFVLASLPAKDFPGLDDIEEQQSFAIQQGQFKSLLEKTAFAMAQQDVRYYLNGILMEISQDMIKMVATDGHRLALSELKIELAVSETKQIIIPRKAVLELARLLEPGDGAAKIVLSQNHIRIETETLVFTSKLIDGKFPEFKGVLETELNIVIKFNRAEFIETMNRAAVLTTDRFKGVKIALEPGVMRITANNPEQEEAIEEIEIDYDGETMETGYNITYLIEAARVIDTEEIELHLQGSDGICIIKQPEENRSTWLIMPMRI